LATAAGDLRGGLDAGHVLGQHRRHAAAERVVHAAGAAGGDGDVLRVRRHCKSKKQGERPDDELH
jgi:hypothetical protein